MVWWGIQNYIEQTALKETYISEKPYIKVPLEWGEHREEKGAGITPDYKDVRTEAQIQTSKGPEYMLSIMLTQCPTGH